MTSHSIFNQVEVNVVAGVRYYSSQDFMYSMYQYTIKWSEKEIIYRRVYVVLPHAANSFQDPKLEKGRLVCDVRPGLLVASRPLNQSPHARLCP